MIKRNRGFTLVEVAIVIAFVGIASIYAIRWTQSLARDAHAQVVKSRIEFVLDAIDRYYMYQVTVGGADPMSTAAFPSSINALQSTGFIKACAAAAVAAGQCIDYRYLPFGTGANGQLIGLSRATVSGQPVSRMSIPLASITDRAQKASIIAAIGSLPGFTINAADTVVIDLQRPGQMVQQDMLVSRDGSREMLADWNFGNHSLNVGQNVTAQNLTATNNINATNNITGRNITATTDLTANRDLRVRRNVTTDGWLRVLGNAFLNSSATVGSNLTVNGTSTLNGNVTAKQNLQVDQAATVGTTLNVGSKVKVDSSGISLSNSDILNPRYIIDVNDMTIAGLSDRTLVTGLRSTGSVAITGATGKTVRKPQCPSGYTPAIEIWNIAVGYSTVLLDPSNTQAWYVNTSSTQWTLHFRVNTQISASNTGRKWTYQGVLGYTTWCEL